MGSLQEKLKKKEKVTKNMVNKLVLPNDYTGTEMMSEIMVPIDIRGIGDNFDAFMDGELLDIEQMVDKMGPRGAAAAILKAKEYYDGNKNTSTKKP